MSHYANEHASALADVAAAGTAVTFTRETETYNQATDVATSASSTSIAGYAIKVKGRPDTYRALSLIESTAPTLFFVPTIYGGRPKEGDAVTWAGDALTVKDVDPLAIDGTVIAARIVCVR